MNNLAASPSRTYVLALYDNAFVRIYFKQFTLPKEEENTCTHATWYFYNRLDSFSCGNAAYPIEMHKDISII